MSGNTESIARAARTRKQPRIGGMTDGPDSLIDAPFDLRPDGTTRTVSEAVIDHIHQGDFFETATARAGISGETAREWTRQAGRAQIRLAANPTTQLTTKEHQCLKFTESLRRAEAEWESQTTEELDQIARGGRRINIIREHRKFVPGGDPAGILVSRDTEVRTLPPDPRVLQWRLEKRLSARYGQRIAVTVEEPVLSDEETATTLVDELNSFLESRSDAPVVEAETPAKAVEIESQAD